MPKNSSLYFTVNLCDCYTEFTIILGYQSCHSFPHLFYSLFPVYGSFWSGLVSGKGRESFSSHSYLICGWETGVLQQVFLSSLPDFTEPGFVFLRLCSFSYLVSFTISYPAARPLFTFLSVPLFQFYTNISYNSNIFFFSLCQRNCLRSSENLEKIEEGIRIIYPNDQRFLAGCHANH